MSTPVEHRDHPEPIRISRTWRAALLILGLSMVATIAAAIFVGLYMWAWKNGLVTIPWISY